MEPHRTSRREFLKSSAAVAGAAALPFSTAHAQARARYRRMNVSDPGAARDIASFKKAIRAMLALPPSDPRNWYRNALVHTLDCPHGNWWFLPWHRAYLGWFEQACRELSGDPDFALPYWDWTREPRVPARMFEDVLTPDHGAFVATFKDFRAAFDAAMRKYWSDLTEDQFDQMLVRCQRFPDDLWFDMAEDPRGLMFFDQPGTRGGVTAADPGLEPDTAKVVTLPWLLDALAPRDFVGFGSLKTRFHSTLLGFGVLEGFPHNRVHNNLGGVYNETGGFMQGNLSPVDPAFFLHHANIDRIWDVWTRKQERLVRPGTTRGYPTLPEGSDLEAWSSEPFLFFVDAKGDPVARNAAGDYATIGDFAYDYQPGSGEEIVPPAPHADADFGKARRDAPKLFARITLDPHPMDHASYGVAVNGHWAGEFSMFGHHGAAHGPYSFLVPLSGPLAAMRAPEGLGPEAPLDIRVVPRARPMPKGAKHRHRRAPYADVASIAMEAH